MTLPLARSRFFAQITRWLSISLPTIAIVAFTAQSSPAISVQDVPNPRQTNGGWVTDMAEILSPATEAELNQKITQLEAQTTAEMAVVTVPDTEGYASPKAFTTELFNTWGIGKAEENNGVLFMVSIGDRRIEIETGIGSSEILTDEKVQAIVDNQVIPLFKAGDFNQGVLDGTVAVIQGLKSNVALVTPATPKPPVSLMHGLISSLNIDNHHPVWFMFGIAFLGLAEWSQSILLIFGIAFLGLLVVMSLLKRF